MTIQELNKKFAITNELTFTEGKGKFPFISIKNDFCHSEISLYGAHITSFKPKDDKDDLLWMSPSSNFEAGKPIRGGIPICFPWFGPHASDTTKPLHGFVRTMVWDVLETSSLKGIGNLIRLGITSNAETRKIWNYDFSAELIIQVGKKLDVSLKYTNTGIQPVEISNALHTYFNISNVSNIKIEGLGNTQYRDALDKNTIKTQTEDLLNISSEVNRPYLNTTNDCIIYDASYNRSIRIAKKGSNVTVVWNPWSETCKNIADMPDDGYQTMICVEAANAFVDAVNLKQGESHIITTIISVD